MKEEQIKSLLDDIFGKTFQKKYIGGDTYTIYIVEKEARLVAEQIIRGRLADSRDERIGVLEAKVFAYEKIISNSNFAPILLTENKC